MKKRNPFIVICLMVLTFSIYGYFYIYLTTSELKKNTGNTTMRPGLDLILILIGCSPYMMYIPYRNQKIMDDWHIVRLTDHKPRAKLIGLLTVGPVILMIGVMVLLAMLGIGGADIFVVIVTLPYVLMFVSWTIALFIYQTEQNILVDMTEISADVAIFE